MTTHMGNRADEPVPVSMHYAANAEWLNENMLLHPFTCLIPLSALSIFRLYLENQIHCFSFANRKKHYLESFQVICTALDNNIYLC